jgi:hypothetical protein
MCPPTTVDSREEEQLTMWQTSASVYMCAHSQLQERRRTRAHRRRPPHHTAVCAAIRTHRNASVGSPSPVATISERVSRLPNTMPPHRSRFAAQSWNLRGSGTTGSACSSGYAVVAGRGPCAHAYEGRTYSALSARYTITRNCTDYLSIRQLLKRGRIHKALPSAR